MTPERWAKIEELYHSARERKPDEWPAYVAGACGGDEELRRRIELMLAQDESVDDKMLDHPAADVLADSTVAQLAVGQQLGRYKIEALLGVGGMGQVYKALDTRLGRRVAIKTSLERFSQRFEREARAISALNHPHVCTLYDVGPNYLVMELVEGETLTARLKKDPLPMELVLRYGAEMADGLALAHARGIIHRDLKPGNIMLTRSGVKVLDFGLAKLTGDAAAKPAETLTLTQSIMGTLAYMAPEQLEGKECDARSDVFSMGLVLYEMVTGRPAFAGDSQAALIAEVMRCEPDLSDVTPPRLARVLKRSLARDAERRWHSVMDMKLELEDMAAATEEAPAIAPSPPKSRMIAWSASILAVAVLTWCAAALLLQDPKASRSVYQLTPFATALTAQTNPLWSPDGKSLAFVSREGDRRQIWVQPIDGPTASPITGSAVRVVQLQCWSPDSRSLYFSGSVNQQNGIYRIAANGGEPTMIQPGNVRFRATISPDGKTLVTLNRSEGKIHVWITSPPGASGKLYEPSPIQTLGFYNDAILQFAPDGKKIMLGIILGSARDQYWLLPWPPGKARSLFENSAQFTSTPHFAWMPDSRHGIFATSSGTQGELYLADLDSSQRWPLFAQDRSVRFPTVSPDGSRLAYQSSLSHSDVIAMPLGEGPVETLLGSSRFEQMAAYSRVAQQLVYVTDRRGPPEVWLTSKAENWDRLLVSPGDVRIDGEPARQLMNPVLSPDGRRVAFHASTAEGGALYSVFASGGSAVRVTSEKNPAEGTPTWSPDGNWLAFGRRIGENCRGLAKVQVGSGEPPVDLAERMDGQAVPEWSPSGEWIAFYDVVQGNIHLTLVSPDGKKIQRLGAGAGPVAWARDGKTLYQVRTDTHALVAIDVATGKERTLRDVGELVPFSTQNPGLRATLTPDGKSIVYTVARPREEVWILNGLRTTRPWYARLWPTVNF